jgi:GAF domain-containing protein
LLPSLVALAALVLLDIVLSGADTILVTSYALAPFVAAIAGGRWATALVGGTAILLAASSGIWNQNFGDGDYLIRVAIVAGAAAFAVLGARSQAQSAANMARFALLNDVSAAADGSAPLAQTMRLISGVLVPGLADFCLIDTVADGRVDRVAVRAGGDRREEIEARLLGRPPSLPDEILESADTAEVEPRFWERITEEHLRSIAHDEEDLAFLRELGVRSAITLPLTARGRRVGALTLVAAWSGRRYDREDLRFTKVLGDRVALALDNAGLFSDLQSVERRMDSVMAVLDQAVLIHDRSSRLVFANAAAAELLGFDSPEALLDAPPGAIRDRFDLYDEAGTPLSGDDFSAGPALRGSEPGPLTMRAISRGSGKEIWLRSRSRGVDGPDEQPLYAVTALEDITDIKQREFEQTLLARLGDLGDAALQYDEVGGALAELLIPQLADWCSVYMTRGSGPVEQVAAAPSEPRPPRHVLDAIATHVGGGNEAAWAPVLRRGEPVALPVEHGSALLLPLVTRGHVVGVLALFNDVDRRPFDRIDWALGRKVASRAAVTIDNARLVSERSKIAETLQQGLLPAPIPNIPGWSIAALYRPAGAENAVGGDFYDAFLFRGGWMLVVGDVTGRGASAASITAIARYTLRTASVLTGDPLVALAALNRELLARDDLSLCSVAAVALPEHEREVRIAVAGHPSPLLLRGASVRETAGSGPVLGALADGSWELHSERLDPGDQLVVYTDGVTEAESNGDRFGEGRLQQQLIGCSCPAVSVQRLERVLEDFCEGSLHDDAAVLAIGPSPGRLADRVGQPGFDLARR